MKFLAKKQREISGSSDFWNDVSHAPLRVLLDDLRRVDAGALGAPLVQGVSGRVELQHPVRFGQSLEHRLVSGGLHPDDFDPVCSALLGDPVLLKDFLQ